MNERNGKSIFLLRWLVILCFLGVLGWFSFLYGFLYGFRLGFLFSMGLLIVILNGDAGYGSDGLLVFFDDDIGSL